MATVSPTRPSRRAATRKKIIVEESENDEMNGAQDVGADNSGEDFTPVPQRSPKRQTRRKTTDTPAVPRNGTGNGRARTGEGIEPSQIFDPEETIVPEPVSPKKTSPRKRKSAAAPRKGRASLSVDLPPPLPTPKSSQTPEPSQLHGIPLGDITNATINEQTLASNSQKDFVKVKPLDTLLEKPMDIVVRSRSMAVPPTSEPTGPKARTVIKYLILTNFKSYAGRQEVGPFHASFSAVVGPNGSGKSNVIDSLLFVFGFRASKMRQGKISALIHNSAAFPDLDFCEVEVHFQEVMDLPDGKHEVLPDSTLVISRKAFTNNASKYYINDHESNFTAVTALLRDRGVDLDHKRFLILQGEVESIAQMKPKAANEHDDGLLEYLEDIIGTSKYKSPIEESAAEVESLNEVCVEKSARVQHVEREKNSLEDKKNKALAFVRDENELVSKQSALYQVYLNECGDNIRVTEEALAQMQGNLNAELEKHQGSEDGIRNLEKQYKRGAKEYESLQKATEAVIKEMAKFDKENVKYEEKKKFLVGKQKKLEKALQASRLAGSEATSLIGKHSDDIERNTAEIAALEKAMRTEEKELTAIRDSLKGKTQAFSEQIAVKQKSLEPWKQRINERQSAIAVAQSELDILLEKASAGAVSIREIQEKITVIVEGREARTLELEEIKTQKGRLEKEANKVQTELTKLSQREPEMRSQLSGARQKADEARASLSRTQTQGNVLAGLMRLKESGRIEGFHGRLGNLGTIDQKYDVAISTACPSLENLVVDTVDVGQQCIDYLRKNNLGRANIILLDRLARRDLSALDTPEGVPRLFDLVKAKDERYRPAFFSVLQNTLVAKDLEQANRIAYGARRWRVVTLDGQLIDVSGTMSGGGTRVARGGMSSKLVAETSKEQVSKLEVDRDALEQQYQTFQAKQHELKSTLRELNDQIPQLETKTQKLSLEIESSSRKLADAQRRVSELAAEQQPSKSDDARVATLRKQIVSLEKDVGKIHNETVGLEEEIKSLQDKIMEVGGVKLRSQKAKVDGLKEQTDILNEEISNAEVAKSKTEKLKTKQEKAFGEAEHELESTSEELEQLIAEVKNQATYAAASKRKAEEAQEALEVKKEELATLKQELDAKTAELNETRGVEIEMRNRLEENQKVLAENQKRLKYWGEKLSKLTMQNVSDLGEEHAAEELPQYTKDELADIDKETLKGEIAILEEKTQNVNVELGVLAEYRRRVEEHSARSTDLQQAVTSRDAAKKRCDELRRLRLEGFMEGFSMISLRLKEMYQMITMGGNAELELVDSLDPFSEGILFSVMPPKKSWKNISNLSGGEKTLSSLALVFALHHYKPTPLYVMDEIDAALDFRNVSIVASYIKERTKNAQFIVISLRNNMFELASRLIGVYKVNHMTKSVTVENKDYIIRT
ncbi:nuclear condensin complex subunit smc4 [Lasallia pustulata]|uniref:Structural maintenance of chromosomes protein n=1 Tax=Lasallia pustulata TaxID=136370 RepID=A0A1W5DDG2_9LECA|nr:nuclear condensin complex subunit smc4 [Lasallia pustulata]